MNGKTHFAAIVVLVVLGWAAASWAVGNRPAGTLVLDTSADHYAALADAIVFSEGSGTAAAALAGRNFTLAGSEDTDFAWGSALGGGYVEVLTTSGKIVWPAQSGGDSAEREAGTILAIVQIPSGDDFHYVYSTGRTLATAAGVGQANILLADATGASSATQFSHKDSVGAVDSGAGSGTEAGVWIPVLLTWETNGTAYMKMGLVDNRGTTTVTRSPAPATGLIIKDTHTEGFAIAPNSTGGANDGQVAVKIAAVFRWSEAFDDTEIASALADPWQFVEASVAHKFYIRNQTLVSRQLPTQVSLFKTAAAGADVAWRVRYGEAAGWDTNGVLSSTSTSTQASTEERLELQLTGLTPNTEYRYGVEINTHGAGWVEISTNGSFWTSTSGNADTVRGMVMSDCHTWQNQDEDATTKTVDIQGVVDVAKFWDVQATLHLGDITSIAKTGFDDRAAVGEFYQYYFGKWSNLINSTGLYVAMGNHDLGGCEYYGETALDTNGYWQQWGTEFWKACFGNPAETWTAPLAEWMRAADAADPSAAWVAAPNRQPFETMGTFRHGPVEFFFMDSERFGPTDVNTNGSNESCSDAAHATLGATQRARLRAAILSSTATFKIPVAHRPTGGYDVDGAEQSEEIYRRGSPAVIARLRSDYEWADDWTWFGQHGVQVVMTGHDHLASIVRLTDSPQIVSIVAGSPLVPFNLGYDSGYNASPSDPHLGPYTAGTSLDGVEALFFSNDRGVWIYSASGAGTTTKADDTLTLRWVRTVNDARDGTLNEVGFTYTLRAGGVGTASPMPAMRMGL